MVTGFLGKHRKIIKEIGLYGVVALFGLMIDFAILVGLTELISLNYLISATIAFIFAAIINYILSEKFVFEPSAEDSLSRRSARLTLFVIVGIIGLIISLMVMAFATDIMGLDYRISKIIAILFSFIANFIGRKLVFSFV